jgi:hypothetical protein
MTGEQDPIFMSVWEARERIAALRAENEILLAILRDFRAIPAIPLGPGGSSVPFVRAITDVERRADEALARAKERP